MAAGGIHPSLWLAALLLAVSVVRAVCASDYDEFLDENSENAIEKRNVAWWARSGNRKFFFPPRYDMKRNVAWFAKSGGRNTALLPEASKRLDEDDIDGLEGDFEGLVEPEMDYTTESDSEPYFLDKRNIASLVNSKTIPSFIRGYKRHIGPALRYRGQSAGKYHLYERPEKRYFASLLKSENPPHSMYSRMNRRYLYYNDQPMKRFFSSLLENDYGAPGEAAKRNFASLLKSDSFKGKRPYSSLLKSESGVGISGKRSYSSILDNTKAYNKRFVGSLLKSSALDTGIGPSSYALGSLLGKQVGDFDKRNFASLINRQSPYSKGRRISKRHVGSLRDSSKRFYEPILDHSQDGDEFDKRSFESILKSSSYKTPGKKHVGSALRYRPSKREPDYDQTESDEEVQLDELNKRYMGSLMDTDTKGKLYSHSPGKRHFASLLDSPQVRSFDYNLVDQLEDNEEKRHLASLLDSRQSGEKRFVGSLKNSDTPFLGNSGMKRYLGSTVNSRMAFKNGNKRFLGSAINSRTNFKNGDIGPSWAEESNFGPDKRFVGSVVQSRMNSKQEGKRFYASVLDNTRKTDSALGSSGTDDKRFVGSALKSKSPISGDVRTKRNASEAENGEEDTSDAGNIRRKRSLEYYDDAEVLPLADGPELVPEYEMVGGVDFGGGQELDVPAKRFLPGRFARTNWFPEYYYSGYNM